MFKVLLYIIYLIHVCDSSKNNVLFIILDDLRPALSCYKDVNAYSPNIDKLSSHSFLFKSTYAQQALCAPSRNSLLTSRRPDTLRLYDFYSYWRDTVGNFTTIPQLFKENGYHTHSVGKVFHPGISSNFSDDQPYSWSETPFHPATFKFKNAKVCPNNDGTLSTNLICPVITRFQPLKTLPDIESTKEAIRFLNERNKTLPFFLAVGLHKPHIPFKFPVSYLDFHPLENISIPVNRFRPSLLPVVAWNPWTDIRLRDDIKKLNISFPFGPIQDHDIRKIKQAYYASVTYVDDLIGQILNEIDLEETIVVLTSDHGWSIGQHGEFSKFSNFMEATHVPLIIQVPKLSHSKVVIHALTELVDLFPTLVDLTQVSEPLTKCPKNIKLNTCTEGESLLPVMLEAVEKQKIKGKSAVFTQYPRPGPYPTLKPNSDKPILRDIKIMGYSMITRRFRYTEWVDFNPENFTANWEKVYGRELYDLIVDPQENMNLAGRDKLQKWVKYLKTKLKLGWRYV